jgi:transposase
MMGFKAVEPKLFLSFNLDSQVPRTHVLRRIGAAVDFSFVRELAKPYYSHTGQPSVDPVVLFKLCLLGYLFGVVSERRLCEEAGLNMAWRWFLGYELDEAIPDHSVLSKARRRFGVKVYEQFFARVVKLCQERGLIQGKVLFLDSTQVAADASMKSLRSRTLQRQLGSPRAYVHKVWHANPEEEPAEDGVRRTRPGRGVANREVVSTTDRDAQISSRPGRPHQLAHKAHFGVDGGQARVITAVEVRPATEGDGQASQAMLDRHQQVVGRAVSELVADSGYSTEDTHQACAARGVQPVLASIQRGGRRGVFPSQEFKYVPESDHYLCPAGQVLRPALKHPARGTTMYMAARGTCAGCPLKAQCAPGKNERRIARRWNQEVWDQAAVFSKSRQGRRLMRRRGAVIEPVIGDLKTKHGLARAQFRGHGNLQIQALLTAAVLNLKALARWRPLVQAGWAAATPPASLHLFATVQQGLGSACRSSSLTLSNPRLTLA